MSKDNFSDTFPTNEEEIFKKDSFSTDPDEISRIDDSELYEFDELEDLLDDTDLEDGEDEKLIFDTDSDSDSEEPVSQRPLRIEDIDMSDYEEDDSAPIWNEEANYLPFSPFVDNYLIKNGIEDDFGVLYSKDFRKLLKVKNSNKLPAKYIIKEGTQVICDRAFINCNAVCDINLPDSVSVIGERAFFGCDNLRNIVIPNEVSKIPDYCFYSCRNLLSIKLSNDLTTIGTSAFSECPNLKMIEFPDSLKEIHKNAFSNCESLTELYIPNSVTSIGDDAFARCCSLKDVTIDGNIEKISGRLFFKDISLSTVKLNGEILEIGSAAFSDCVNLSHISMPESLVKIGNGAFYHCSSLQEIKIPLNVNQISSTAFALCSCDFIIEGDKFSYSDNLLWANKTHELLAYTDDRTRVKIPEGIKVISSAAFYAKFNLIEIHIPASVEVIDTGGISQCNNLQKIYLPEKGLQLIATKAFSNCIKLKVLAIPETVSRMGIDIFEGCSSLEEIYIKPELDIQIKDRLRKQRKELKIKTINNWDVYYKKLESFHAEVPEIKYISPNELINIFNEKPQDGLYAIFCEMKNILRSKSGHIDVIDFVHRLKNLDKSIYYIDYGFDPEKGRDSLVKVLLSIGKKDIKLVVAVPTTGLYNDGAMQKLRYLHEETGLPVVALFYWDIKSLINWDNLKGWNVLSCLDDDSPLLINR